MRRSRRNRQLAVALYLNAALLAAVLLVVLARGQAPSFLSIARGAALSPQPIAGGEGVYLMPAQFSQNTWGCYLLDVKAQSLCAYRYRPTNDGADLQLVAVRNVAYDHGLTNFNSNKPSPEEVKQWVDEVHQGIRGRDGTSPAPSTQSASPAPQ